MSEQLAVSWAGRSEIGRVRERNEDAFVGELRPEPGAGTPRGLFVVCDGMGGHAGGAEASQIGVRMLCEDLRWVLAGEWPEDSELKRRVHDALVGTHHAIFDRNEREEREATERAGTTGTVLLLSGAKGCVGHVGDSRVYRFTRTETRVLTADHNVANREIARGDSRERVWGRADARHLTQALGVGARDQVRPDIIFLSLEGNALFLLCTDGLSDNEFVERHASVLLRPLLGPAADLARGCDTLIKAAEEENGHDNLTAILVLVSGGSDEEAVGTIADTAIERERGTGARYWLRHAWRPRR